MKTIDGHHRLVHCMHYVYTHCTISLETTLADHIVDRCPNSDILTPIQGSSSVSEGYKTRQGNLYVQAAAGKVIKWGKKVGVGWEGWGRGM